jgi:NADPH:quinone reductase-like Zn-dependent oxidoreductase
MKAFLCTAYGATDVLQLADIPTPEPKPQELRVAIHATTVTAGDWRVRSADVPRGFGPILRLMMGWSRPRQPILGCEMAGVVDAVGEQVSNFAAGDRVLAYADMRMGCHAQYNCLPASAAVVKLPDTIGFETAAAAPFGGCTALRFLRKGKLAAGEHLLVNGASGAVGSAAIQLGKHFGAKVTAVCSAANAALARELGADKVIDYQQTDFASSGQRYDVILDSVGNAPYSRSRAALADGGRLLMVVADLPQALAAPWRSLFGPHRLIGGTAMANKPDLQWIVERMAAGEFRPVVDQTFPFNELPLAHQRVESHRKRGAVVVSPVDAD